MKAILRFQLPATVGSDLAGVVLEVGHHVTRFKPGCGVLTSFVLVAILRRDKFVLALSAPLASLDAAESVACLQWVTDTCGVAFFKNKKEHARRATAMWMPFVVIMATRLHL